MQIYISKNNQQLGPFDDARVLEMLRSGELSADDAAIRRGENEWRKLGYYFPNSVNVPNNINIPNVANIAPAKPAAETPVKGKSRKGLFLGCGGIVLVGLLIAAVLGFLAFRNLNPADSTENLPDSIKTATYGEFKLMSRNKPRGNVWGTEQTFVGVYNDETKSSSIIYLATVYANEDAAKKALEDDLDRSCKTGEDRMRFNFVSANGSSNSSEAATCAAPLYVRKGSLVVTLGGAASPYAIIEAAEALPFNAGTQMKAKEK